MKTVLIKINDEDYATARIEAERVGMKCVGSKIAHDIHLHYSRKTKKVQKNER